MFAILGIIGLSLFVGAASAALYYQKRIRDQEQKYIRLLRLRRNLLNAFSHQIREPLNKLFPQVQMLSRIKESDSVRREKLSASVSSSVKSVADVLETLVDVVEAFDGQISTSRDVFGVDALINAVLSEICPAGFRVQFSPEKDGDESLILSGYADQIKKTTNAIVRHCAGVSTDNELQIRYSLSKQENRQLLKIVFTLDNIVFSKQLQQCYFDFSYSEANPHLKGRPDSLIGLFLAREAAMRTGGALKITQVGATKVQFEYLTPIFVKEEAPQLAQSASSSLESPKQDDVSGAPATVASKVAVPEIRRLVNSRAGALTGKLVLIVDDVETNRLVLEEMLRTMGLTAVVHACGGQAAIDYCRQLSFDLVFMDIQMPDIDGLKATENIRLLGGKNKSMSIIAVTAASRIVTEDLCTKSGMNGFLEKPLSLDDLQNVIKRTGLRSVAA